MAERRPRSKIDDILDVLDVGLQGGGPVVSTRCARCFNQQAAEGSDFCLRCRHALLYEDDPESAPPPPLELDVVLFGTAGVNVTGFVPEDAPPLLRGGDLTAEDVERLTEVIVSLDPGMRELGRSSAVLTVQLVQFIPAEFVEIAAKLEDICRTGVALGLTLEACEAVVDEEVERCHRSLDGLDVLPGRALERVYRLAGVCSCHLARHCPLHEGGPR